MNKYKTIPALLTAFAMSSGAAVAASSDSFKDADANADGHLSLTEMRQLKPDLPTDHFMQADQNVDGLLDREEFERLMEGL